MINRRINMRLILTLIIVLLLGAVTLAQDTPIIPTDIDTSNVSDDAVNAIAEKLYCPVCENIPLDTCGTAACADWREEIRAMLAMGMPEEEIIDNFVTRFGDRVVGTPRDPAIRTISLVTPWLVVILGIGVGLYTLFRWQRTHSKRVVAAMPDKPAETYNKYREQLEKDLTG
jgi:cytochrome c-type biogenesis protein CcmH